MDIKFSMLAWISMLLVWIEKCLLKYYQKKLKCINIIFKKIMFDLTNLYYQCKFFILFILFY